MRAKKITAWSFSRYLDYKQCPFKAKCKHIDKIKEPPNPAMARGSAIHDMSEKYIKGVGRTVPKELKLFSELFKMLRKRYKTKLNSMVVEDMWAFTKSWDQTQWNNWAECFVRIKVDTAWFIDDVTMIVNDWKTGKYREDQNELYVEQLELYALAVLILYEHVEKVVPQLTYLDVGFVYPPIGQAIEFTRKDIPKLKKLWAKRIKPMLNDTIFAPTPNRFCNWCYFKAANKDNGGGQCKF